MSKVIDEVRRKIASGQNLFRRSTIEKMLAEYDRLLMRNTALEKNAVEQTRVPDALSCEEERCKKPAVMHYCEDHAP